MKSLGYTGAKPMQSMAKRFVGLMMLFKPNRLCIRLRPGCAFIASASEWIQSRKNTMWYADPRFRTHCVFWPRTIKIWVFSQANYFLGIHEVTQNQYLRVMGSHWAVLLDHQFSDVPHSKSNKKCFCAMEAPWSNDYRSDALARVFDASAIGHFR
jgi:hypothetical protein